MLGNLQYDVDPTFHVKVGLNHPPLEDPDALPMWEMMITLKVHSDILFKRRRYRY